MDSTELSLPQDKFGIATSQFSPNKFFNDQVVNKEQTTYPINQKPSFNDKWMLLSPAFNQSSIVIQQTYQRGGVTDRSNTIGGLMDLSQQRRRSKQLSVDRAGNKTDKISYRVESLFNNWNQQKTAQTYKEDNSFQISSVHMNQSAVIQESPELLETPTPKKNNVIVPVQEEDENLLLQDECEQVIFQGDLNQTQAEVLVSPQNIQSSVKFQRTKNQKQNSIHLEQIEKDKIEIKKVNQLQNKTSTKTNKSITQQNHNSLQSHNNNIQHKYTASQTKTPTQQTKVKPQTAPVKLTTPVQSTKSMKSHIVTDTEVTIVKTKESSPFVQDKRNNQAKKKLIEGASKNITQQNENNKFFKENNKYSNLPLFKVPQKQQAQPALMQNQNNIEQILQRLTILKSDIQYLYDTNEASLQKNQIIEHFDLIMEIIRQDFDQSYDDQ